MNGPAESMAQQHWNSLADASLPGVSIPLWRRYCDQLHCRLLAEWLGERRFRAALKTDLFDEMVGDGLAGWLLSSCDRVEGVDVAAGTAQRAAIRHPQLVARQADVRRLEAYPSACFDLIVSNSTLDHFTEASDLDTALGELTRVLLPGGRLLVTLDNPRNPVVSIRNRWCSSIDRKRLLVPYYMGHTVPQDELCRMVEQVGLEVERAAYLMHVPRVLFLHASRWLDPDSRPGATLLRFMHAFELLERLPTRAWTACFSAVLARKPMP